MHWPNNLLTPEWSLWTHRVNKTNTSVLIHCHCLNFLRTTAWWASSRFIEYILGTGTFKSAKFVNLEPSLTWWMFFLHNLIWPLLMLVNCTAFWVFITAKFYLTTTKMFSDLTVVFFFAIVFELAVSKVVKMTHSIFHFKKFLK